MIISPDTYKETLKDKTYAELLSERDSLIKSIKQYEKERFRLNQEIGMIPFSETIYHCNLLYLAKVCEMISEVSTDVSGEYSLVQEGLEWICAIKDFLSEQGITDNQLRDKILARKAGKVFTLSEHVEGLIYSLLSNQRPWKGIVEHLDKIKNIFFQFDVEKIKATEPSYFVNALCNIKCGNRDINKQMESLSYNIRLMETMEKEYGSMDLFVTSAPANIIVKEISDSKSRFKFQRVGEALAWEYLRNVGIDGCKPDVHLCRFFGADRMRYSPNSPAKIDEVCHIVEVLSKETGMLMVEIDTLIWNFCSTGNGEICSSEPKCHLCPIKEYCKF